MLSLVPLLLVPISFAIHFVGRLPPIWDFVVGAAAIAILANWSRRATEQLADHAGPAIGGLITVSFGSVAEIILALFVLISGEAEVVRAQLIGSIIGTTLLGLGVAILAGGATRARQTFDRERVGLLSTMLVMVLIALLLPAVFDLTGHMANPARDTFASVEPLSLGVSVILLLIYCGNLTYTLVTHHDVFSGDEERGGAAWPLWLALAVMVAATIVIAAEAEFVSDALVAAAQRLHLTPLFLGVVALALVGTGGDLIAAVFFARQDRMGLVLSISIGSAIQIALVVAPLLVLISWLIGHPMTLVFRNPLELFAVVSTVLIVRAVAADGETTWFEGLLLVGVYLMFALGFLFMPAD